MCKLIAVDIEWDIEKDDTIELPKTIEIPNGLENEDDISDYLSEQTGFCHKGFNLKEK